MDELRAFRGEDAAAARERLPVHLRQPLSTGTAGFRFCHRLRDVPTWGAAKVAYANRHAKIPAVQTPCTAANRGRMPGKRAQRPAIRSGFVPLHPGYDCVRNPSALAQCPSRRRDRSLLNLQTLTRQSIQAPSGRGGGGPSRNRACVSASLRRCCTGETTEELKAGRVIAAPAAVARLAHSPKRRRQRFASGLNDTRFVDCFSDTNCRSGVAASAFGRTVRCRPAARLESLLAGDALAGTLLPETVLKPSLPLRNSVALVVSFTKKRSSTSARD